MWRGIRILYRCLYAFLHGRGCHVEATNPRWQPGSEERTGVRIIRAGDNGHPQIVHLLAKHPPAFHDNVFVLELDLEQIGDAFDIGVDEVKAFMQQLPVCGAGYLNCTCRTRSTGEGGLP